MKKIIIFVVIMLMTLYSFCADAAYLYTESTIERINGAITYEQRNILTDNGWIRAYIAYVDLTNPTAAIKVMTSSEGCTYLDTVKKMAEENNSSIAINGDFFNMGASRTNMLGMVIKDGELVSTPALDNQATFALTEDNEVIMDYFSFDAKVISPQGYSCPIYQINKVPVDTGAITMLTSEWSSQTWGASNLDELVIENDKVIEIRKAGSSYGKMPENGYILTVNPQINAFFTNFNIGDTVTVDIRLNPDISGIKEATGGNTLIVNEGKIAKFTGNVSGYAQRSAVGVSADGKKLILVATDGRQTDCKGLTQEGMAELMITLGAHKAINLDGGGSTTFVKKDQSGQQKTQNSVSSLREVSTAIGVFENHIQGTHAAGGMLTSDKSTVLLGDCVNFVANFYDEYGNDFPVNSGEVSYYDESGQHFGYGMYTPSYAGTHKIYAKYGDVIVSSSIEVVDDIFSLEIYPGDLQLASNEAKALEVYAYSLNGASFPVNPEILSWDTSNSAISVSDGIVTAMENESAVITASCNNKSAFVTVNKHLSQTRAPLPINGSDPLYGSMDATATVAVSGDIPAGATLLNKYFSQKRLENISKYSLKYLMGNYYTGHEPKDTYGVDKYSQRSYGKTFFVTLDSSGDTFSTSSLQKLCTAAYGDAENLIIVTRNIPELSTKDGKRINEILKSGVRMGKNIFVVSSSSVSGVKIENGVRYITVGTVADYKTSTIASDSSYCAYVVFCINGSQIKYQFVNDIY